MDELSPPTMFHSYSSISPTSFLEDFNSSEVICSPFEFFSSNSAPDFVTNSSSKSQHEEDNSPLKKKKKFTHLRVNIPNSNFGKAAEFEKVPTIKIFSQENQIQEDKIHQKESTNEKWTILKNEKDIDIDISFHYRGLKNSIPQVDGELFRPIKYELIHEMKGKQMIPADFIRIKIQVIDNETNEEILKNGSRILNISEVTFTKNSSNGKFENQKMKFQFLDCSYHNERRHFAFKISYFMNDLLSPFLVKKSNPFLVFARKKQEKRKFNEVTNSDLLSQFENKLKEMMKCYPQLTNPEQVIAKKMVMKHFME
jgi:hypothetical protein